MSQENVPRGQNGGAQGLAPSLLNPPVLCLAAALAAAGATMIALGSHLVLFGDDWVMVFYRQGLSPGVFLNPYNEHLSVTVVAFYKLVLATFGMSSPLPFHIGSTLIYLAAATLLFAYMRSRIGDWLALFATCLVLFLGASAQDLLVTFQICFSGAIAAGLGALLALDRDDRRGDTIACVLLIVAISFSEVGLAFTLGALVHVAISRRSLLGRLYVPVVPLILYVVWWLGWGHKAENHLSFHNAATTPAYVLNAMGTALGALLGITSSVEQLPTAVGQEWVPILVVSAVSLAIWRIRRVGFAPRGVWPVLAIGVTFWTLAGLNYSPGRAPGNARYLYPSAVFVLLIASELWRGTRVRGWAVPVAATVTAMAVAANLVFLSDQYKLFWKPKSEASQADLRALEIAGPVNPFFVKGPDPFYSTIGAGALLSAEQAWGSPAYSDSELAASAESLRLNADRLLGAAIGLRLKPSRSARGPCRTLRASSGGPNNAMTLGPGRVTMKAETKVGVKLGRFSDDLPISAGSLRPGSSASLAIPMDGSSRPWRLGLVGRGPVTVCQPGPGAA